MKYLLIDALCQKCTLFKNYFQGLNQSKTCNCDKRIPDPRAGFNLGDDTTTQQR